MPVAFSEFAKHVKDPFRKGIILTILDWEPLFQYIPFKTINGLAYPYKKTVKLPQVGFRKLNEAHSQTSGIVNKEVEALKICGFDSDTDIEMIKAYGREERESEDTMNTHAMATTFVQFFLYGNSGARTGNAYDDDDAFDGIITRVTTGQTVNATGVSATEGSTVFAVKFGDPYCLGLQSHEIDARNFGEIQEKPVERTRVDWATGFAAMHGRSLAIIKNLDTTKTLTVAMMDELKGKFPGGQPTLYCMSDRSRRQLKADAYTNYSITLPLGLDNLGRQVETWDGKPILVSDAVIDEEDNTA